MSEFSPPWSGARMTKSQVRKYVKDMKKAQALAQAKLYEAKANWEFDKDEVELAELEKKLDDIV